MGTSLLEHMHGTLDHVAVKAILDVSIEASGGTCPFGELSDYYK